jgi:mRNA-degrading endonuclease RelE of RelBE toxin-antitoxin system
VTRVVIAIDPEFLSQYETLPKPIRKKFKKQLAFLRDNLKPRSLQIHRMQGTDYWEFYVDKGYRCMFKREGNMIRLLFVGRHELIDRF